MRPEGRMGHLLRGHEGERNNCFSKVQLVGQKYRDQTTLAIYYLFFIYFIFYLFYYFATHNELQAE